MFLRTRRITTRESVFDNNVLAVVPTAIESRYLRYWLETVDLREIANPGPVPSLDDAALSDLGIPVAAAKGQRIIADYLDAETAQIDALIKRRRHMIGLLDEAWRSELATMLDPSTGVRLKHLLAAPLAYGVLVPEHDETGVPMLRITDLRSGAVNLETVARVPVRLSLEYRRTVVAVGDLVVSVVGTLGRAIEVGADLEGCNLNRALARVQLQPNVPRTLIRLWFESDLFADQARLATSGDSAQPTLGLGDMKNFLVGLPWNRSRWPAMTIDLEGRHTRLRKTADALGRQLELLYERRRALIIAAVTGELDVAKAA